jgi:hypothetical protein
MGEWDALLYQQKVFTLPSRLRDAPNPASDLWRGFQTGSASGYFTDSQREAMAKPNQTGFPSKDTIMKFD